MIKDYSSIYAVTDDKFKKNEFDKKVPKQNQMITKVLKLDIFFILVINIQNH